MEVLYVLGGLIALGILSGWSFMSTVKTQKKKWNEVVCNECVKQHPEIDPNSCNKDQCTYYEESWESGTLTLKQNK